MRNDRVRAGPLPGHGREEHAGSASHRSLLSSGSGLGSLVSMPTAGFRLQGSVLRIPTSVMHRPVFRLGIQLAEKYDTIGTLVRSGATCGGNGCHQAARAGTQFLTALSRLRRSVSDRPTFPSSPPANGNSWKPFPRRLSTMDRVNRLPEDLPHFRSSVSHASPVLAAAPSQRGGNGFHHQCKRTGSGQSSRRRLWAGRCDRPA